MGNGGSAGKQEVGSAVIIDSEITNCQKFVDSAWSQTSNPTGSGQLVTDVGSTKREIVRLAATLFNAPGQAAFLPSHPMAGKEVGGAAAGHAPLARGGEGSLWTHL